jgi:peptidyl-tRNA hydrolase, PTH1 family
MKYLIVGLGNIGPEYLLTRHNVGFMVLDRLAGEFETKFSMERLAYHTEIKHKGKQIHLIKPTTFMNLSGKAVNYWMKELKIEKDNILIITDDIALPYGKLRMKPKGSHGGHNGLRNIQEILGDSAYARLRIGVGDDFGKGKQIDYVLGDFQGEQFEQLPEHLDRASEMILSFCLQGLDKTMNAFNQ